MTKRITDTAFANISIDYTALENMVTDKWAWSFIDELNDGETIDWSTDRANYFVECQTNMYLWTDEEVGDEKRSATFYLTIEGDVANFIFKIDVYDLHDGEAPVIDMGLYDVEDVKFYL